jgi:hypothetical protein
MSIRKKHRPKPILDRLPIRPPFTKAEWKKMTVSDVAASRVFLEYFGNCLTEAARSDRARVYLTVLTATMHFGRLPDFAPRSIGKFLAEAERQTLSLPKLENALEAILGAVAEEGEKGSELFILTRRGASAKLRECHAPCDLSPTA